MPAGFKLCKNNYSLENLIDNLEIEEINNFKNCRIDHIIDNSKEVKKNSLFVAITGFNTDGHQYIFEAIQQGAKAVLGEKKIKLPSQVPYIRVKDSRKALAKVVTKFYNYPAQKMKVIGVTGSAGKTTTVSMLDNIINQVVDKTGLIGTLHTKIGNKYFSNPNQCTTPGALTLQKRLFEMQQTGIDYTCMEVSSHSLKLDRVMGVNFDIGIFTNLSYDHMEFHQTMEDYYQSKEKLFSFLKPSGGGIFNLDDDYSKLLIANTPILNCYTYGIESNADITGENIKSTKSGLEFEIKINNELLTLNKKRIQPKIIKVNLSVLGYHNVYNALASFITALMLGFKIDDIKAGLESFSGVTRRMELIHDKEFTIIDDFAHNPASLTANFKTIKEFNYNNLVIIHFLKGNRGVEANKLNAQLIKDWSKKLNLKEIITTRCNEEVINKNKVLSEEEKSFTEIINENHIKINNCKRLDSAIKLGLSKLEKNDLLLLIGGPGLNRGSKIINQTL